MLVAQLIALLLWAAGKECQVEGKLRQGGKSNVRVTTCWEFLKNIARYRAGTPLREWRASIGRKHEGYISLAATPANDANKSSAATTI